MKHIQYFKLTAVDARDVATKDIPFIAVSADKASVERLALNTRPDFTLHLTEGTAAVFNLTRAIEVVGSMFESNAEDPRMYPSEPLDMVELAGNLCFPNGVKLPPIRHTVNLPPPPKKS